MKKMSKKLLELLLIVSCFSFISNVNASTVYVDHNTTTSQLDSWINDSNGTGGNYEKIVFNEDVELDCPSGNIYYFPPYPDKERTLDLNGHNVSLGDNDKCGLLLDSYNNSGTINIIDSSAEKTGVLNNSLLVRNCKSSIGTNFCRDLTVNIEGGTYVAPYFIRFVYDSSTATSSTYAKDVNFNVNNIKYTGGLFLKGVWPDNNVLLSNIALEPVDEMIFTTRFDPPETLTKYIKDGYKSYGHDGEYSSSTMVNDITLNKENLYISKDIDIIDIPNFDDKTINYNTQQVLSLKLNNPTSNDIKIKDIKIDNTQEFTLIGNETITLNSNESLTTNYTLMPKTGLESGIHKTNIIIIDDAGNYFVDNVSFEVKKYSIAKPTIDLGTFFYDGNQKQLLLNGFNSDRMQISGNQATEVGTYEATVSIKNKANYSWPDGSTDDLVFEWKIEKNNVTKPSIGNNRFEYNGEEHTLEVLGFNPETQEIYGNVETEAGHYQAIVYLKENWTWQDGTEDPLVFDWEIYSLINDLTINGPEEAMAYGNKVQYSAEILPYNATNQDLEWNVENITGEATIDQTGLLTIIKNGLVKITAKSKDGTNVTDELIVNVTKYIDIDEINIIAPNKYLSTSESIYLKANVYPFNATNSELVWTSSNTSIASVNSENGAMTTKNKQGNVTITATAKDGSGKKGSITFIVGYPHVAIGEETSVGNNSSVSYDVVEWEITNQDVLEKTGKTRKTSIGNYYYHSLYVRGVSEGTSNVIMKTISGDVLAQSKVYVYTPLQKITANYEELNLEQNEEKKLEISYSPENANDTFKKVMFVSENNDIVSIDKNGNLIAHNTGKTNIIVSSQYYGLSITIPVNVVVYSSSIETNTEKIVLNDINREFQLEYQIKPDNATDKNVTLEIGDEAIAAISDTGVVKAIKNGNTTITIKSKDGKQTKIIPVIVSGLRKDINNLTFQSIADYVYNALPQEPEIIIKEGNYKLEKDKDFTVSFDNNVNVGKAIVSIIGIGNYKGNKDMNFNINKAKLIVNDLSQDVTVKYDERPHTIVSKYESDSSAVIKYMDKNGEYTLSKIPEYTEVGDYFVKYKIFINDNYSAFYGEKKLTILPNEIKFKDVNKNDWYYESVKKAYLWGIIKGYNDTTFGSNDKVTRGQLVTILWRMEEEPDATSLSNPFKDVGDDYFTSAIKWASSNDIIHGYNATKFGPNDPITRQDLAVILNNYAKFKGINNEGNADLSTFADYNKVKGSYAEPALKWAVENKVMSGQNKNGKKYISPSNNATRAETAAMIINYIEKFNA